MNIGDRFGQLTVTSLERNKKGVQIARTKCDCGNTTKTTIYNLRYGKATSCGCYRKQRHRQMVLSKGSRIW